MAKQSIQLTLIVAFSVSAALGQANSPRPQPADLVVTDARIYTEDAQHRTVQALAVRDGKFVYAGTAAGASAFIGSKTRVERLDGRLVLPGLIDSHIHPAGIVQLDVCDLDSQAKSLAEITEFVRGCIGRYHVTSGKSQRMFPAPNQALRGSNSQVNIEADWVGTIPQRTCPSAARADSQPRAPRDLLLLDSQNRLGIVKMAGVLAISRSRHWRHLLLTPYGLNC